MRKVGIVTQFHNSINYGGVLQAYALCCAIKEKGIYAEQIRFMHCNNELPAERKSFLKRLVKACNPVVLTNYVSEKIYARLDAGIQSRLQERRRAFLEFCEANVPQSSKVFAADDIVEAGEDYDVFVTGSDQVWNPRWYQGTYFLDFVPKQKRKISYAASLGVVSLTEEQQDHFRNMLVDFHDISVREEDAVALLQPVTEKEIKCVLDPTMLLSAEQWDMVCDKKQVNEPYLLCYFLGKNKELRKKAKQYASAHCLKIVTIPHADGSFTEGDNGFGDIPIWDASPAQFLSLIKYADCVFTNSFHAAVFSGIYKRQFFVFHRYKVDKMVSRIYTLMRYFGSQDHFCNTEEKCTMEYLNNAPLLSYDQPTELFLERKKESYDFLMRNLTQ